jgi:hypothetical protein
MTELTIGNVKISQDGIVTKTTLLIFAGILLASGVYDIEEANLFFESTLKIVLGCLLIFVREYAKSLPNGCDEKGVRKW